MTSRSYLVAATLLTVTLVSCATRPGTVSRRTGDEIIVAGIPVHTGTRVITWMDPGGYDAYRVERRFAALEEADWETSHQKNPDLRSPNRYSIRKNALTQEQLEQFRGGGWDLPSLQKTVDQFVIHFDVAGTSRNCFKVLHDGRCLSVHFMLDVDGTIYQTLDLKERAWHATSSNDRSVGIEIANMGAYSLQGKDPFDEWYTNKNGETFMTVPERFRPELIHTKNFTGQPARSKPVVGEVQGRTLRQYDYTPQQYEALVKLTAALCKVFPKIKCDYPREADGTVINHKLPDDVLKDYQGVIGHYHIQTNKTDPGPAFQWDYLIGNARRYLASAPAPTGAAAQLMKTSSVPLQRK